MNFLAFVDIQKTMEGMVSFDFDKLFVPEIFSSCVIILLLIILCIATYIVSKKAMKNPLKTPKGLMFLMCLAVEKCEDFVVSVMGEKNRGFSGYILALMTFTFFAFTWGLTGMASPMTYFGVPFSLALITFILIHAQAVKTNKWRYFHRYVEPFPFFLPINLVTMWAPLLSLSLRMFGNAMAGFCLMSVVYYGCEYLSTMIIQGAEVAGALTSSNLGPAGMLFAPLLTPILHAYFDLFSGAIQTIVFTLLTLIYVYQEQGDEPEATIDAV